MMKLEAFENYPTHSLKKRKKLSDIALYVVWVGGVVGMAAAFARFFVSGTMESTLLFTSLIALLASIPAYRERKRIIDILNSRTQSWD